MDKEDLPHYTPYDDQTVHSRRQKHRRRQIFRCVVLAFVTYAAYLHFNPKPVYTRVDGNILSYEQLESNHALCSKLQSKPSDPSGPRSRNARWNGGNATLIRNTTFWTGEPVAGEYIWQHGDVLLENGLIARVGRSLDDDELPEGVVVHDGSGKMLTAGIVDMHSHAGDSPLPATRGGEDTNEMSSDTTPYVRSIDAINPLDPQIQVIKSGGVTTSLILPGSGNNIGGEAFVIKHAVGYSDGRPELSAEDMLADPEHNWRYMKMACGENAKRDFGPVSRMGEAWEFRNAFSQAKALVQSQDDWCAAADQVGFANMQTYLPQELKWESLAAVLRGHVHVNTHCYTVPDLEAFIRHTNEFKFPVRAFHHAHQTYLVPEILKRNYGGRPPAAALFADNMYYKVESYVGSEQAGKILNENGITPVYVSDNPVINAQHVLFEAAKAYKYGLPYHVALAGVTSASAELLGLGERIGKVKESFDADLALWDSDPLSVGATPVQVWIDGTPQFKEPVELKKPDAKPINHEDALEPSTDAVEHQNVVFTGVSRVMIDGLEHQNVDESVSVVVKDSRIECVGTCQDVISALSDAKTIHLTNGHFAPPATAFGSYLGIEEISAEEVTNDGGNNAESFSSAIDGLALDSKSLQAAYAHGVTRAISAPAYDEGGHKGISVGFRVNAKHGLEKHAIFEEQVALHYTLTLDARRGSTPSISSLVNELEVKLLKSLASNENSTTESQESRSLHRVVHGELPLVITVHKADTIASLLRLKSTIDAYIQASNTKSTTSLRLIILGAAEAHLLAPELAAAKVGVILAPPFPYAESWDQRRSLTGAPLTNGTAIDVLHSEGVDFALGTAEDWQTRDLYLFAGIAHANGGGKIGEKEALGLVTGNVYGMLGLEDSKQDVKGEWVVFEGSPLEIRSRVVAVADGSGKVSVWA
jgi:imidazolonepropionase-like amidohydrolase